jgi:hypothetical protein
MPTLSDLVLRDVTKGLLPRYLYKYRPIDGTLDKIIDSGSLWFANPLSFNDPFDCQIQPDTQNTVKEIRDYIRKNSPGMNDTELKEIVNTIIDDPDYWPKILKAIVANSVNTKGICCFTSHNESVLMWSHYANCHKGVTLKFDITENPDFFIHPIKVTYSDDYPIYNHIRDNKNLVKLLIQNKSTIWSYEEEVRILKPQIGVHHFDKKVLIEVTFGSNCDATEINRVRKLMLKKGYDNTVFKKATVSKNKYQLEFENV